MCLWSLLREAVLPIRNVHAPYYMSVCCLWQEKRSGVRSPATLSALWTKRLAAGCRSVGNPDGLLVYARVLIIRYRSFDVVESVNKTCCTASFENQRVKWKDANFQQKSVSYVWYICRKAVLLHPLSREKRRWVEMLKTGIRSWTTDRKNFLKIFSWKVLVVQKIALPLHPLSERKPLKKSSLKDLDISKQVVQDLSNDK